MSRRLRKQPVLAAGRARLQTICVSEVDFSRNGNPVLLLFSGLAVTQGPASIRSICLNASVRFGHSTGAQISDMLYQAHGQITPDSRDLPIELQFT